MHRAGAMVTVYLIQKRSWWSEAVLNPHPVRNNYLLCIWPCQAWQGLWSWIRAQGGHAASHPRTAVSSAKPPWAAVLPGTCGCAKVAARLIGRCSCQLGPKCVPQRFCYWIWCWIQHSVRLRRCKVFTRWAPASRRPFLVLEPVGRPSPPWRSMRYWEVSPPWTQINSRTKKTAICSWRIVPLPYHHPPKKEKKKRGHIKS